MLVCGKGMHGLHDRTVKRLVTFPSPAGMSLTKLNLGGNNFFTVCSIKTRNNDLKTGVVAYRRGGRADSVPGRRP
jgi:hypothetical protein